jgi:hypothetical protein
MTAKQYRDAIYELDLTKYSAAAFLGVTLGTAYNYANGATTVPEPVARLLKLSIALNLTPEQAAELWQ